MGCAMLYVSFQIGLDRYIVEALSVLEVLPLVALKSSPQAPRGVAGAFIYRGQVVPVLDFGEVVNGTPCARRYSTRILMLKFAVNLETRMLGLIVERATSTLEITENDFMDNGFKSPLAPYLGRVIRDEHKLIHSIDVNRLVPQPLLELLY